MLEHELAENGYSFMRLDGRMNISQRAESVRAFAKDPNVSINCWISALYLSKIASHVRPQACESAPGPPTVL